MITRLSAQELYKIDRQDLLGAIEEFESGHVDHRFVDSQRFDLLIDGYKRYPPKAIVGLAAREPLGKILTPDDISGGESTSVFRLLIQTGFEIATKPRSINGLDVTFSVGENDDTVFIIWESRGPDRNVDYLTGLESLLAALRDLEVTIDNIYIDSSSTRAIPIAQRRIQFKHRQYPIGLRDVDDLRGLRQELTSSAAKTARDEQSGGGGNPTKRIRIEIDVPDDFALYELAAYIAGNPSSPIEETVSFEFKASAPAQDTENSQRKSIDTTVVTRVHAAMQKRLHASLVAEFGVDRVSSEQKMASGRPADLVVNLDEGLIVYEIKTARSPRDCIRQAFGQLLEYAYWPGSPPCAAVWVVGPSEIDSLASQYLVSLEENFGLPIRYRQQEYE